MYILAQSSEMFALMIDVAGGRNQVACHVFNAFPNAQRCSSLLLRRRCHVFFFQVREYSASSRCSQMSVPFDQAIFNAQVVCDKHPGLSFSRFPVRRSPLMVSLGFRA
ncbi:hypothetical protein GCM10023184_39220 [Flaviaesturariibacter amylovorans]|uniref:Uncharacterized protein n=1 Tax=Flaviaesturariibacter amylovorans TaxID=1084520 RepID=A0ABP8HLR1_9BACT